MQKTLPIPNAIIFIYDRDNQNVIIPEYSPESLIAQNAGCVSVATQADVDGEVTLNLKDNFSDNELVGHQKIHSGYLETPHKKIGISTSENEAVLECLITTNRTLITIWVDDTKYPSSILVLVK